MSYAEKLKDPRWQKVRLQVFDRDNWECLRCDCDNKTLHAHHLYYEKGKDPWEYDLEHIVTLCEDCHSNLHGDEKTMQQYMREIRPLNYDEISPFNSFYRSYCENIGVEYLDNDRYCKSIRAYFSYSEINFTTRKNITKRLGDYYMPITALTNLIYESLDEISKLIILSQSYVDIYDYRYNEIENIIALTIRRLAAEDRLMYLSQSQYKDLTNWEEVITDIVCSIINKSQKNSIFEKKINYKKSFISVKELFEHIKDNEDIFNIHDSNFMWDERKWIECFDSIDYTPPELRNEPESTGIINPKNRLTHNQRKT